MNYYLLRSDFTVDGKWRLGDVRDVDNWLLINPPVNFMEPGSYTIDTRFEGREVDYSLAGYASVPVLSESAVQSLLGIPEVDAPYEHVVFAPINIEPQSARRNYFLMIIETQIDCVDEERSDFIKFDSKDPVRPDLSGSYQSFFNLVVDPKKIGDSHIFRVMGYIGAIVVSEEVRDRFERAGVVGAIFESVNGDRVTVA